MNDVLVVVFIHKSGFKNMYLKLKLLFCDTNFKIEKSTSSLRIRKVSHYTHTHTQTLSTHSLRDLFFFLPPPPSIRPSRGFFFASPLFSFLIPPYIPTHEITKGFCTSSEKKGRAARTRRNGLTLSMEYGREKH